MGRLGHELGKQGPFASAAQEAYLNVVRTASALGGEFAALFRSRGLSASGYNALRILRGAGEGGRTCQEVGQRLVVRVPDVTRLVDRLERGGLVERRRSDEDRRVVHVRLTPAGAALLGELDGPVLELHERQMAGLSPEELGVLNDLLERARAGVASGRAGGGS